MHEFLNSLDWSELREQKQWLIRQADEGEDFASGLLSLLDGLQDLAVDVFGYSEREVFGFSSEDEDRMAELATAHIDAHYYDEGP